MTDYIDIIRRKRDGEELSATDIRDLVAGYMSGSMTDYQMSAWLMAAFLKGLTLAETLQLTDAMIATGKTLDLSVVGRKVVDKHSTGGVGDKVSLVLGPLVASCGAVFGKMSGRGLGHTGGTVDKLESIPGFKTTVDAESFIRQLREVGVCIAGQSKDLVPADDRLYSLRDVTATVDSNPLTAASIMSKKIAAGAGVVVLDVKVGRGAFFRNKGQAAGVAHLMQEIGKAHGMDVVTVMTAMEQPLGHAVGNTLEVLEALETLRGEGPADLVEVVVTLAGHLLSRSDLGWDRARAEKEALARIKDGTALEKFRQWVAAQGGDASVVDDPVLLPLAEYRLPVSARTRGYVSGLDALAVGRTVLGLGAGRQRQGEDIDRSVGAVVHAKVGDRVEAGEEIASVYGSTQKQASAAVDAIGSAYSITDKKTETASPVLSDQLH